jgi:hypothetical protein
MTLVLALPACTLCKPIIGALVAPAMTVGEGGFDGCGDGQGYVCGLCIMAGVGAACGFVTGAISDVQALTGAASADPTANWWDPFRTNTDPTDRDQ